MGTTDSKTYNLLVVEDEPDLRECLALTFRIRKYNVLVASNGGEALEILRNTPVDLVLSDVRMPKLDGIELLKQLNETEGPHPAFIFLSGHVDVLESDLTELGAKTVFAKPFNVGELDSYVKKTLMELLSH